MSEKIRVVIADDHPVARTSLHLMLGMEERIELVDEAADGFDAVHLVSSLQPNVVLMDLLMPAMDGLEAIEQIREQFPHIAIIVLTTYDEGEPMLRRLQAGVRGYLLKDSGLETVLQATEHVARGELLRPELMQRILDHAARRSAPVPPSPGNNDIQLTEREQEVLAGIAAGERGKKIGSRLGITRRTVESYLNSIYLKLNVDSHAAAVAVAIQRGLLPRRRENPDR